MKAIIAILTLFAATNVFATEGKTFNFGYYNSRAFYSCSYVEAQAKSVLAKLGAQNIETNCTGGIQSGPTQWLPINLNVTFVKGDASGALVLRGRDSCDVNVKLIDKIMENYDHKDLKKQESCWDAQGNYTYQIVL